MSGKRFCPKCGSEKMEWMGEYGLDIGLIPYKCLRCGFKGLPVAGKPRKRRGVAKGRAVGRRKRKG